MALFKSVPTNFGGNVNTSYHRVESLSIVGKSQLSFTLASFFVEPKKTPIEPMSKSILTCSYDMESSENPFQQAYSHIKSLPEWDGADDC